MKKVLFASTALVAFGLAGAAQAADPIALKLGGYSKWVFGYADQDDNVGGVAANDYQEFDIKGSNEVFFLGSTTLDNGLKIGVDMQLEAGGVGSVRTDPIDEAYITVDGGFGRIIMGVENSAAYLLHVSAPNAAGDWEETEFGLLTGNWVVAPGTVTGTSNATALNTDGDAEKITYMTPSFAGFTAGVSYIPAVDSAQGHVPGQPLETTQLTDWAALGLGYNNSFGGVGVKLSAGYLTAMDDSGVAGSAEDRNEWSLGAQVGFAGFTVGGAFRDISQDTVGAGVGSDLDVQTWTAGVQYATGPFAVSVGYFTSENDTNGDEMEVYQLSGKYNMGPGVDWIASIGHQEWDDAGAGNFDNDGWAAYTGLALAF